MTSQKMTSDGSDSSVNKKLTERRRKARLTERLISSFNINQKLSKIAEEASDYVEEYRAHITGRMLLHPRQFQRKYQYSTLPYFHDIMRIKVSA